jgi:hypothetical protein
MWLIGHMRKWDSIGGQRFGRLTAIRPLGEGVWEFQCDCGQVVSRRRGEAIKRRAVASCGCWQVEQVAARNTTHGGSFTNEYGIWRGILQRCLNPNNGNYHRYGGRGITVCERWLQFENFRQDMGPRPSKRHSIDRTDNSGPYCPENCQWRVKRAQQRNMRTNRLLAHAGETLCIAEWAERIGVPAATISRRLFDGWTIERALTTRPTGAAT